MAPVILAVDVAYAESGAAFAAALAFRGFDAAEPSWEGGAALATVAPYEPGAFFKRELPCVLAALRAARDAGIEPDIIVIDGYASFGSGHRAALGEHVARETGLPVIGVAKTSFAGADHREVLRGASAQPLFVTAVGIAADEAALAVRRMHGEHRIPALLARVDRAARSGLLP